MKTKRLSLRNVVQSDFERIHKLVQAKEIYQFQPWGPNTKEDTQKFITSSIEQVLEQPRLKHNFAIEENSSGLLCGACRIDVLCTEARKAEIGYWISLDSWGKGYATEMTKSLIEFGFETLNMNRIQASASSDNPASLRVLEKSGMIREGVLRDDKFLRGKYRDSVLMAILKKDWTK